MGQRSGALFVAGLLLLFGPTIQAQELPPLEAYGALPVVDMLELSPSGNRMASRITLDGQDLIAVKDIVAGKFIGGANARKVNPRWLNFVDEDQLVMVAGATVRSYAVRNPYDFSAAYSLKISSNDVRTLLQRARGLYAYQSGLGRIIGRSPEEPLVYMPAYSGSSDPSYSLYAVNLETKRERRIARGNTDTIDWFVDQHGSPFVREDFDDDNNVHKIWAVNSKGGSERLLYEQETEIPLINLVGVTPDRDALVFLSHSALSGVNSYYLMSIEDGEISGPVLERDGLGIERVISDINRVVHGVEYEGFLPKYAFFDDELNQRFGTIQKKLSGTSVRLTSWSSDFSKIAVKVSGGWHSGAYLLFEDGKDQPTTLALTRPAIEEKHVALTVMTYYEAQDGLAIPTLIHIRKDVATAGAAPLIVMPHGGPESHDRFGFDWLAQYFASRGFVVLQPQFRGSSGFGTDFILAGHGEWGGKMQSDLDDGVRHLVKEGIADPDRVCILGASYGGYAALAAGAFSPEMYRCVVAIAPVSDLRKMLRRERSDYGRQHWVIDYWEGQYGAGVSDKDVLQSISPALHASSFKAPVLLLHGKKDTVVPIEQSKIMHKALKRADKDVTFVQLKGEDHWLSQAETRLEALQLIAEFIDEHL